MVKTKLDIVAKLCKFSHHYMHLTYLTLVFFESHGLYGIAAGALGVVVLIEHSVEHVKGV
jgi:hypothetical protein